jgi:hypothetical protein
VRCGCEHGKRIGRVCLMLTNRQNERELRLLFRQ